jgi:hypothetical protein
MVSLRIIIAASAVMLLQNSTTALAQSREQQTIDEIVRKSEAREVENGFCSRTGWPNGSNWEGYKKFLTTAAVGSWKVNTYDNGNCELDRVTRVHQERGAKCVSYSLWTCTRGGACGTGATVDCLEPSGQLRRRE